MVPQLGLQTVQGQIGEDGREYSSYTIDTFSLSITLSLTTHPLCAAGRKYAHYGWQRLAAFQRVAEAGETTEVTPYGKEAPGAPSVDGTSDITLPPRPRRT